MFKDFFVAESNNDIASLGEIAILSPVAGDDLWPSVPVCAVTLDYDRVFAQFEINHELIEHNYLLIEGNATPGQCVRHFNFKVGARTTGDPLQIAENAMVFAAILAATHAARKRVKGFAAIVARNIDLWFPFDIVFSLRSFAYCRTRALLRAVALHLANRATDIERLAASFAGERYRRGFLVSLFATVAGITAFVRAELYLATHRSASEEITPAFLASDGYAGRVQAFFAAKVILAAPSIFGELLELAPTSAAIDNNLSHKKRLLSQTVNALAEGAQPTIEGRHNYNFVRSNRQATASLSHSIIAHLQECRQ